MRKIRFGQFFTPAPIARFMADLFAPHRGGVCRLLDPGAGLGSLSIAFLERWSRDDMGCPGVELDAFEIDACLCPHLRHVLGKFRETRRVSVTIRDADFIKSATERLGGSLFSQPLPRYTHAILNPPYKKIRGDSEHRMALRSVGIETVNLYSAFVALSLCLLEDDGQLVAVVPRSFCNGPYYRPFREFILTRAALRHIHLFESRSRAFKDDGVLQENIIIRLERGGQQGPVVVSTSTDGAFADLATHEYPFGRIVFPDDAEQFIHVPASPEESALESVATVRHSLPDVGIAVSTGPVVDFRLREHLRDMPDRGTVPLLYPAHFSTGEATWPIVGLKKPNAIQRNDKTERWLHPNGYYCVVRRFSAKEEKRRIVASVVDPNLFGGATALGFENHLNLFHENKRGLPQALARGLAAFLNTAAVDEAFRRFSGHTQVNATDLRLMKYPSRDALIQLGEWAMRQENLTQALVDARLGALTG
jgi:tRNA1(Val) A37 N6-methylase TrmN6